MWGLECSFSPGSLGMLSPKKSQLSFLDIPDSNSLKSLNSGSPQTEDIFRSVESGSSWTDRNGTSDLDSLSLFSSDVRITTEFGIQFDNNNLLTHKMNGNGNASLTKERIVGGSEFQVWNPNVPPPSIHPAKAVAPFIILVERTIKALNVGKLSLIKMADLIASITEEELTIQRRGQNQVKITCEDIEVANTLIMSTVSKDGNFRAYVPNSMVLRRGLVRDIDIDLLAVSIADRIKEGGQGKPSNH